MDKKVKLEKEKYKKDNGPFVEIKFKKLVRSKSYVVRRDRMMWLRESFDVSGSMINNESFHQMAEIIIDSTNIRQRNAVGVD